MKIPFGQWKKTLGKKNKAQKGGLNALKMAKIFPEFLSCFFLGHFVPVLDGFGKYKFFIGVQRRKKIIF